MAGKRDAAELEELTEEERAALEEADAEEGASEEASEAEIAEAVAKASQESETETAKDKDAEADKDADADADAKSDEDEEDAAADADAEPEKGAAEADKDAEQDTGAEADADEDAAEIDDLPPARTLAKAPEKADEKLAEIDTREDALSDQFDNGDLTAKEYRAEQRKLDAERFEIRSAVQRANDAVELRVATWKDETVPAFFNKNPEFDQKASRGRYVALEAEVVALQKLALEKGKDHLAPAILEKAAAKVRKDFGLAGGEGADQKPKAERKAKSAAEKAVEKAGKRPAPPKTLASLPASDPEDTDGSEFSQLDRLADENPEAFEDAFARLPEADRARYLGQH